jgi:hypothetical protein
MRAGGRPLFNRYVIVGISEAFRVAIKKSRVRWHMIVLSIIARRRAQSVAVSISRKIREKDATCSRKKRLGYLLHTNAVIAIDAARISDNEMKKWIVIIFVMPLSLIPYIEEDWREEDDGFIPAHSISIKSGL